MGPAGTLEALLRVIARDSYHFMSANGAFVALAPIPLGWLIAYAFVYLVRWIRAGFKP